jgi:flavin-dependent dehydrogenase
MRVDVVVVGAGPAGCSAAYHATRAGLEVLLLDQHESRQDRADGDALFPRAVAEVSLMGLADWLEGPNHYKYEGIVVHARTARLREPNSPTNRHGVRGYVIPWFETVTRLLERAREAGATFLGGVRARSLLRSPSGAVSGVQVGEYGPVGAAPRGETMRHKAPLVIVADGAGDFAGDEGTKAPSNGVTRRQYFTGVDGPEKDHLHVLQSDALNGIGAGYVYYLGDGRAAVGGSVWTRAVADCPETLREGFDRMMGEAPLDGWLRDAAPASEAESWRMKLGMWGAKRSSQGLMLVGYAGNVGHPVCSEGYGGAMVSGRIAA